MDQELREYLEGINVKIDRIQADIFGIKADIADLKASTDQKISDLRIELKEHVEVVETRLLSEFWKWARTSDIRARQQGLLLNAHASNAIAFDERMMSIEERLSDLERRH